MLKTFIKYSFPRGVIKTLLTIILIALLVGSTVLLIKWSGWLASWMIANWHGERYSSLNTINSAIYGMYRYFIPALIVIIITIAILGIVDGSKILGLQIRPRLRHIIAFILFIPVFYLLAAFLVKYVDKNFTNLMYKRWHYDYSWHTMTTHSEQWGYVFYTTVCAPIGEEIIFRGWLYGWLRKIVPGKWFIPIAIIISSVLFGWIHNTSKAAIYAFAFGVCLCLLRESTKNIYGGLIIHSLWNLRTFI